MLKFLIIYLVFKNCLISTARINLLPNTETSESIFLSDETYSYLDTFPYLCLDNISLCSNGFLLMVNLFVREINISRLLLLSSGGISSYSNGFYLRQLGNDFIEFGVALESSVYVSKIPILNRTSQVWYTFAWNMTELSVYTDNNLFEKVKTPLRRNYINLKFDPIKNTKVIEKLDWSTYISEAYFFDNLTEALMSVKIPETIIETKPKILPKIRLSVWFNRSLVYETGQTIEFFIVVFLSNIKTEVDFDDGEVKYVQGNGTVFHEFKTNGTKTVKFKAASIYNQEIEDNFQTRVIIAAKKPSEIPRGIVFIKLSQININGLNFKGSLSVTTEAPFLCLLDYGDDSIKVRINSRKSELFEIERNYSLTGIYNLSVKCDSSIKLDSFYDSLIIILTNNTLLENRRLILPKAQSYYEIELPIRRITTGINLTLIEYASHSSVSFDNFVSNEDSFLILKLNEILIEFENNFFIVKANNQIFITYRITFEEIIDEEPEVTVLTKPARRLDVTKFLISFLKPIRNLIVSFSFGDSNLLTYTIKNQTSIEISHIYNETRIYSIDIVSANRISKKKTSFNLTVEKAAQQFDFKALNNASDIDTDVVFEVKRLVLTKSVYVEWIRFFEDKNSVDYLPIIEDFTFELYDVEPFSFVHRYARYGVFNPVLMIKNEIGFTNLTCLVKVGAEIEGVHVNVVDHFVYVGNPVNIYIEVAKGSSFNIEIEFNEEDIRTIPWNEIKSNTLIVQKIFDKPSTYLIQVKVSNFYGSTNTSPCANITVLPLSTKRFLSDCKLSFNGTIIPRGLNNTISIESETCKKELAETRNTFFWSLTQILKNQSMRAVPQFCLIQSSKNALEILKNILEVGLYNLTVYVVRNDIRSDFKKIHGTVEVQSSPLVPNFFGPKEESFTIEENFSIDFYSQTFDPDEKENNKSSLNFYLICVIEPDRNFFNDLTESRNFDFRSYGFNLVLISNNILFFEKNCLKFPELVDFNEDSKQFMFNMSILNVEGNSNFTFKLLVADSSRLAQVEKVIKVLKLDAPSRDLNDMMKQLDKLDEMALKDPKGALMFLSAFSTTVNDMDNGEVDSSKMIRVRGKIIDILGVVSDRIDDANSIESVSNVISSVTNNPDQIPLDFQESSSQIIQKMGEKSSQLSEAQANNIGTSLVGASSNVFDAAVRVVPVVLNNITDSELEEDNSTEPVIELPKKIAAPLEFYRDCDDCEDFPEDRYQAKLNKEEENNRKVNEKRKKAALVGKKSKNGLSGVANALGNDTKISQKGVSLAVVKGSKFETDSGSSIALPQNNEFNNKKTKLIVSEKNPYQSVGSNSAVHGSIVTLELSDSNGQNVPVNNSKSPFVIKIPNTIESEVLSGTVNLTEITYHKVFLGTNDSSLGINLIPEQEGDFYHVYISHSITKTINQYPNELTHDYKFTIPNGTFNIESSYKILISNSETKGAGMYFIGIKLIRLSNLTKIHTEVNSSAVSSYQIRFYSSSCKYWSEEVNQWRTDGCFVGSGTTYNMTECLCYHLTTFGSDFYVPPNKIDFTNVWAKFKNLNDNAAVFSTVIVTFGVYIIVAIWARFKDKKDLAKWEAAPLNDNLPTDEYFYLLSVQTGVGREAGCRSNVSFVLSGDNSNSGVRRMTDGKKSGFDSGTVRNFLMSTAENLGTLTFLRIWHDNIGYQGVSSWFLNTISVVDLQTSKKYVFICNKWLAVEKDDGQIDRTLIAASQKDLAQFSHLFTSSVKKKFTDGHLWFSVFSRPTKSHFTRLQRISCCLSLLFCTMIANAMFYQSSSKTTSDIQIGPIKFTLSQLYTSFISTLIVVPTNLIIVTIFRKAKGKYSCVTPNSSPYVAKRQYWRRIGDNHEESKCVGNQKKKPFYKRNSHFEAEEAENHRLGRILPYWTIYIGWTLCFISSVVPAFFIILYSMEWGRDRSNEWLASIVLSLVQSILVIDPIKVLIITAIITCILRKPEDDFNTPTVDPSNPFFSAVANKDKNFIKISMSSFASYEDLNEKIESRKKSLSRLQPINQDELKEFREKRLKEIKLREILMEVISYLAFLVVLLFICYQSRDTNTYLMHDEMKKAFLINQILPFEDIKSRPDFWTYLEEVFLPELYASSWYNGNRLTWREKLMTKNRYSIRVGAPRIRQLRIKKSSCNLPAAFKSVLSYCRGDYDWLNDDTNDYDLGWSPIEKNTSCLKSSWCYQNTLKTKSVPLTGLFTTYKGGGYVAPLSRTLNKSIELIEELKINGWLDQQTRAIFLEFTVYNPNVNLFASATFIIEYLSIGSAITYYTLSVFRLYNYVGSIAVLLITAQIVFILFIVFFTFREINKLRKQGKAYFGQLWNLNELFIIIFSYVSIGMFATKNSFSALAMKDIRESELGEFVNFNTIALWDDLFCSVSALVAFSASLKFLKLLRFNKRIGMLSATLKYARKDLQSFSIACILILLAYSQFGYSIFGQSLSQYRTFLSSIESVFLLLLGQFDLNALMSVDAFLGFFFFATFVFFVAIGMMTIFMAILEESFGQVKEDLENQENEYELIDILNEKLKRNVEELRNLTKKALFLK